MVLEWTEYNMKKNSRYLFEMLSFKKNLLLRIPTAVRPMTGTKNSNIKSVAVKVILINTLVAYISLQ